MTTDPWDDFQPRSDGQFVKWAQPGDTVVGTIVRREKGQTFSGEPCPQIVLDTADGEKIITAAQANLEQQFLTQKAALVPGARVKVTFTGVGQAKPGQAPPKLFDVTIKADTAPAAPAPAAATDDDF